MRADLWLCALALVLLLSACGTGSPAPVIAYGTTGGANSAGIHTVGNGDTVWNIAQRYQIDMKDLIYANGLRAPFFLEKGKRLTLPPPLTYKAKSGDTLYEISRMFSVSATRLVQQNNLKAPYKIRPGQTLRLPAMRPPPSQEMAAYRPPSSAALRTAPVESAPLDRLPPAPQTAALQEKPLTAPPGAPAARQADATPPPRARADGSFAWPVQGSVISSYGPKKDGLHNDGINIRAPKGAPVRAAENGIVVYADNQLSGFGNLVLIRHENRWMSAYAHLDKALVKRGQKVRRGETVGTVGESGGVDSPQLHFELRRGTEALNPEIYLTR